MTETPALFPKEQLTCLTCMHCIVSRNSGVYCRIWSEVVPLTFSQECPAWEMA
jgi:hypothetical protein